MIPSKAYRRWYNLAKRQMPVVRLALRGAELPITAKVEVTAVWFRDRDVGDEDRFKNALGDFLQRMGVVKNDSQIHWGGGCRRDLDRERPRTEVTIEVLS